MRNFLLTINNNKYIIKKKHELVVLNMSREAIAKTLRRLRLQSGLTASEVGALIGKSGKTVNAWENNRGQPDADMLMNLCDLYNVKDILSEFREVERDVFTVSHHEKEVVTAYRENSDMQPAVDRLLGVKNNKNKKKITVYKAARSDDGEGDGYVQVSQEQIDKLLNAPETDDDF